MQPNRTMERQGLRKEVPKCWERVYLKYGRASNSFTVPDRLEKSSPSYAQQGNSDFRLKYPGRRRIACRVSNVHGTAGLGYTNEHGQFAPSYDDIVGSDRLVAAAYV